MNLSGSKAHSVHQNGFYSWWIRQAGLCYSLLVSFSFGQYCFSFWEGKTSQENGITSVATDSMLCFVYKYVKRPRACCLQDSIPIKITTLLMKLS